MSQNMKETLTDELKGLGVEESAIDALAKLWDISSKLARNLTNEIKRLAEKGKEKKHVYALVNIPYFTGYVVPKDMRGEIVKHNPLTDIYTIRWASGKVTRANATEFGYVD